ncbi:hypothetical protein C8R43DRAFT_1137268 [Mycena crocata]|nr:hypothetical protein C8R43DRAFT_1137268 [Mycena crocata]
MTLALAKVNLPLDEMVPDNRGAGRDPRYWCLPPIRDDANDEEVQSPRKSNWAYYLITRGRMVGVWRRWTVAKLMVNGFPDAEHKGHHSYESCIAEWQQHCPLGVHPHPVDPSNARGTKGRGSAPAAKPGTAPLSSSGKKPATQARPRRSLSTPPSNAPLVDSRGEGRMRDEPRYFAIWGAEIVYSTRYAARLAFDEVVEEGNEPELLSTSDFDMAVAYTSGDIL